MRAESLPLDVVVHVHQVADGADIIGDVGIAVDGMLDGAACHGKVDHVHGAVVVEHGVDQTAGKGIAAAHAIQNVKGVEFALKGVAVVPHKGLEAVLAAAVGIAHMAGNALEVGVAGNEMLEDLVLLLIAGLQGHAVLPVALAVIVVVLPQVVGLNAQQNVNIRQALGAEIAGFLPAPQGRAEVAVKADSQALLFGHLEHIDDEAAAVGAQCRGNAAQVQPVVAVQQSVQIDLGEVILGNGTVLAVINDLGSADAVASLQIISTQPVGGGLVGLGQDHGSAMHIVGAQPAHRALAQAVVGHYAEEGAVHTQVGQGQCNVGLAAAVAGFKAGCHADLFVVRRGQTEHDLAAGDKFLAVGLAAEDGIVVFHNAPPKKSFLGSISCENTLLYPLYRTAHRIASKCCFGREKKKKKFWLF